MGREILPQRSVTLLLRMEKALFVLEVPFFLGVLFDQALEDLEGSALLEPLFYKPTHNGVHRSVELLFAALCFRTKDEPVQHHPRDVVTARSPLGLLLSTQRTLPFPLLPVTLGSRFSGHANVPSPPLVATIPDEALFADSK
ncbi:hypothetical protein [Pararhizobium sp. O133]|uniref:hypothetical protein n=1 Tax=Pararhizobium sp. O133 TaxID=3449278 RepID=UPI003F684777